MIGTWMTCGRAILAAAALGLVALGAPQASADVLAPAVKRLGAASPTHVLFVGNSYFYYNDSLHNHVRRMVAAAGLQTEKAMKYKSATIGGAALFDHPLDHYLEPGKLRVKGPFQVVVLQGGSAAPLSDERRGKFSETVRDFAGKIMAAGGEVALYMTHGYVPPHKKARADMIRDIETLYVEAGNAVGGLVIPVGLAFEEAYRRRPEIVLHQSHDGSHPSLLGTYLAASVVFYSLYGQTPVGNAYDYFGKVPAEDVRFLQEVAADTVEAFYARQ